MPARPPRPRSFCNRTADGDASWSVARLEEAAQATYAAVVFNLANPPTDECKTMLHTWVCWQARGALGARRPRGASELLTC